ncbi:hypothetical protein [Deinococcus sp.]|uniref:hypothetical protein n=1 Tax=Deinococcus sp. TaxID=47478 RepID=UPI00286983EE|nr:hypothetical protein [Deinococcus sp.]
MASRDRSGYCTEPITGVWLDAQPGFNQSVWPQLHLAVDFGAALGFRQPVNADGSSG